MGRITLAYPRVTITVDAPDAVEPALRENFRFTLTDAPTAPVTHAYAIVPVGDHWQLVRDGQAGERAATAIDAMFALEEDIENALIARLGPWIGLHAGAVALDGQAIVTLGLPDTGKTSSTFQLVELGLELVSEEVTPVDPETWCVQPFPSTLTLSRGYAETFAAHYPVTRGRLHYHDAAMARYQPAHVRSTPADVRMLLYPRYDPIGDVRLEVLTAADVLTETLRYCYAPHTRDEVLYDHVIGLLERCHLFRLHTRDVMSARTLLGRVVDMLRTSS